VYDYHEIDFMHGAPKLPHKKNLPHAKEQNGRSNNCFTNIPELQSVFQSEELRIMDKNVLHCSQPKRETKLKMICPRTQPIRLDYRHNHGGRGTLMGVRILIPEGGS
jgi:hypothetical protein